MGDDVLVPLLTACLHLVDVLGPHVVALRSALHADRLAREQLITRHLHDPGVLGALLDQHRADGRPLPRLEPWAVSRRLRGGWDPNDPLLHVNFQDLLRSTGRLMGVSVPVRNGCGHHRVRGLTAQQIKEVVTPLLADRPGGHPVANKPSNLPQ